MRDIRLSRNTANFNRRKEIWIQTSLCDVCGNMSNGISSDTSEGEYGSIHICFNCIRQLTEFDV